MAGVLASDCATSSTADMADLTVLIFSWGFLRDRLEALTLTRTSMYSLSCLLPYANDLSDWFSGISGHAARAIARG